MAGKQRKRDQDKDGTHRTRVERMIRDGHELLIEFAPIGVHIDRTNRVSVLAHQEKRELAFIGRYRAYTRNLGWKKADLEAANALLGDSAVEYKIAIRRGRAALVPRDPGKYTYRTEPVPRGTIFHPPDTPTSLRECLRTTDDMVYYKRLLTQREHNTVLALRGSVLEVPLCLFDALFRIKENENQRSPKGLQGAVS